MINKMLNIKWPPWGFSSGQRTNTVVNMIQAASQVIIQIGIGSIQIFIQFLSLEDRILHTSMEMKHMVCGEDLSASCDLC